MTAPITATLGGQTLSFRLDTDALERLSVILQTESLSGLMAKIGDGSMTIAESRKVIAAVANVSEEIGRAATADPKDYVAALRLVNQAMSAAFGKSTDDGQGAGNEQAAAPFTGPTPD